MSALVDLILGVVTSIGGFVEVGSISTAAQAGSEFGFQLLWAVAAAALMLGMLLEMSGRLASVSGRSLAAAVRERFGIHFHMVPLTAELLIDILLLAAEIGGAAIAIKLLTGIGFQWWILPIGLVIWVVLWTCGFAAIEHGKQARCGGDGRMGGIPAGRKGVRHVRRDDGDPRLGQVGHRAEPLDHRVQLGRLLGRDDLRAGGSERQLVGGEVLERGQPDDDQEHRREPDVQDLEEDYGEHDVERAEQERRRDHARRQAEVASESLAFHRKFNSPRGRWGSSDCTLRR